MSGEFDQQLQKSTINSVYWPRPSLLTPASSSENIKSSARVFASSSSGPDVSGPDVPTSALCRDGQITERQPGGHPKECQITLANCDVYWTFQVTSNEKNLLGPHVRTFATHLSRPRSDENIGEIAEASSVIGLASRFLSHVTTLGGSEKETQIVLQAFEKEFISDQVDIHVLANELDPRTQVFLLKTYYGALKAAKLHGRPAKSALFDAVQSGDANICAVFGGQGLGNPGCLEELSVLYSIYGVLIEDLIDRASRVLKNLASLPRTFNFYKNHGFNIKEWLEKPETRPGNVYIASAPLSFPIIGLFSLSNYCIVCKILGKSPGQVRDLLRGVTGHSQGIVSAATVASSGCWETFYESVELALETLFWIGFESHHHTMPSSAISAAIVSDSVAAGEGQPSSMLSIRGLDQRSVEEILQNINKHLAGREQVYLALVNSRDNMVVAGPPKSLRGLNLCLRKLKAGEDLDQSRLPFNERKPVVQHQFLPISAPFHSPHLDDIVPRVLEALQPRSFSRDDLNIAVYHTKTGEDLRLSASCNLTEDLVRMVISEPVDWPKAYSSSGSSYLLDFGPGRIGSLIHQMVEGTGTRVIAASKFSGKLPSATRSDIFTSVLPYSAPNWGEQYRPRLTKTANGTDILDTKMSRLLGVPPVMVAGMTPTTVKWDFVSAIMRAGYQVELAGGGYSNARDFESAIRRIYENVPPQCGITCNLIYANPRAVEWQIPLIRQLNRQGFRIDGLTIGAGIPSAEIVRDYIETIGLKHISFKPGSIDSILQVINIANTHPGFPICLQWTGGRSGGHHSFEDFHAPILETYGRIRQCPNIVLIAGSGFGGSGDTYPYLTGDWSRLLGYPRMPFDGVLLGSRMMVSKEAHTSPEAKRLIAETEGAPDSDWHKTYQEATGGVITVNSEMGQPIHKLATRGVILWKELDEKIFGIKDKSKRLSELQKHRASIIDRLNNDFQKPWFAVNSVGENVELEDMTYLEVLQRLLSLMYVRHQQRWVDASYEKLVLDFTSRVQERLLPVSQYLRVGERLNDPFGFLIAFSRHCNTAETELLHPEDVSLFMSLCRRRGQKPVNFIPRLDESFETWFKTDSLWQAEDIDAVVNQDAQRVCIIHGPVAARHSRIVDEPAQAILDGIARSHVDMVYREFYSEKGTTTVSDIYEDIAPTCPPELDNVIIEELPGEKIYKFSASGSLPDANSFLGHLMVNTTGWAQACLTDDSINQRHHRQKNPIRSALVPCHGHVLAINYSSGRGKDVSSIGLSTFCATSGISRELLRIYSHDGKSVTVNIFEPSPRGGKDVVIEFEFDYLPERRTCRLSENLYRRNERIKIFYAHLWLGHYPGSLAQAGLHAEFLGETITLSRNMIQEFTTVIENSDPSQSIQESVNESIPLDYCIVIAWDALIKPLLIPAIDGDLLRLLHLSNSFEYYRGAKPIQIGDVLKTTSRIESLTIEPNGRRVEIIAEIKRQDEPVVKVLSAFLIQGSFTDYKNTFRCTQEPEMEVSVRSEKLQAVLLSREWLEIDDKMTNLMGRTLLFRLRTQATYGETSLPSSLHVTGLVYSKTAAGILCRIGNVYFETGSCHGNPVMDFLNRHGTRFPEIQPLLNPGWSGESSWKIVMPPCNSPYARVSRDANPIHVSQVFSKYAQLPGTLTHGMYTSAVVRRVVEQAVAEAEFTRFRRYFVSFEGMVLPTDELMVEMHHIAMVQGRLVIQIRAFNGKTGDKVLEAEAEIEQAPTVYLFTGQGSQEKGMGMALYDSSSAARALWDRGDSYLQSLYGFSILDIVRNNPKTLTVHFGGIRGRKIREHYLAMAVETSSSDGNTTDESIIKDLLPNSTSYTFQDERGLLYSTQFAQPALTIMEMAAFEDMKSRGLIQESAVFAGHSLGEYVALGSLSNFMTLEALLSVVFYRGLSMQVAMKRDENGQTSFSMVAVNPSKIRRGFEQESLEDVVKLISKESQLLLEVVNYNVDGQQYVCAGHLRALWVMTQVFNQLHGSPDAQHLDSGEMLQLIRRYVSSSREFSKSISLERGAATIPLTGIDVPFHSTYLRNGIDAYRKFLEGKILEENIDPEKLIGKFIPNVTGKPFSVERSYVKEVAEITGSAKLRGMLETWVER